MRKFRKELGRIRIEAEIHYIGRDIVILLSGGERPHIGALACGNKKDGILSTVFPGHKDDVVINDMAERLKEMMEGTVCVVGGIHLDGITKEEIRDVKNMCEILTGELAEELKSNRSLL